MKFEVYESEDLSTDVVRLRLIGEYGTVKLVAVDKDGITVPGGYLLGFEPTKRGFYLCSSVEPELGFPLSDKGSLIPAIW